MAIPQKIDSVIDNEVRPRLAYLPDTLWRKRDGSQGCEEMPGGLVGCAVIGRGRPPLIVEIVDAAKRIDNLSLKKTKKAFRPRSSKAKCDRSIKRSTCGSTTHGLD